MNRRALLACPVSLLALSLNGCERASQRSSPIPVKIMVGRSTSFLPVFLAQKLGLYERHGLSVTLEDTLGTTKSTQALLGGSVDLAGGMYEQTLVAAAQGKTLTSLATLMCRDFRAIVISPGKTNEIRTIKDLKGASIGVSTLNSPNQFLVASVLSRHRVPQESVKFVAVGVFTTALAALERDRVDAAVLAGSAINLYQNRHPGTRILVDVRTPEGLEEALGVSQYPTTVLYSTPRWIRANKDTARRLSTAIRDSLRWIQDHSPEEIERETPDSLRAEPNADREAMKALKANFSPDGQMSFQAASAVKQALTALPENRAIQNVDLSKTFTNEFVEAK